ncbi:NorM family multidrug efflux MATE transporter [soil metagenome]
MTSAAPGRSERTALLWLALPLAAQQVGSQLMGTVDAAMLGRYSDAALAGAGVGNNLLFAITSIGFGIVMGMDTVVPQALGAGRTEDARRAVGAGIRLAILVGLMATLLVFATPLLLQITGVQADVLHEARAYVYLRAVGIVPFLVTIALRSYLAAHHRTRPLLIAMAVGNIVNFALDYVLIFGVDALGIPAMGVIGAALATTLVQLITMAVYLSAAKSLYTGASPPSTTADLRAILRFGLPVGGQIFAEVGIFGVATVIAAHFGEREAAAHSIALGIASFTFSFAMGVAAATSVRVGNAVGAGDLALARSRGFLGIRVGVSVMLVCAIAFWLVAATLARAFTADLGVIATTVPLLHVAALFQLSDGTQTVAAGALRGLGHTGATLWGNLVGHYVVALPVILILGFGLGLGITGVWWGLSLGLTVTAMILVVMFVRGSRSNSEIPR